MLRWPDSLSKCTRGFTLVELMVALAVTSILLYLASVQYATFVVKAKEAEAKSNLGSIKALQMSYNGDNGVFGSFPPYGAISETNFNCNSSNDIGFTLANCRKARFSYFSSGGISFGATARGVNKLIWSGCKSADEILYSIYLESNAAAPEIADGYSRDVVSVCINGGKQL